MCLILSALSWQGWDSACKGRRGKRSILDESARSIGTGLPRLLQCIAGRVSLVMDTCEHRSGDVEAISYLVCRAKRDNDYVCPGRQISARSGQNRESDLIVPLRSYLASRWADSFSKRQAVMALARLGDQRAQQQIVCAFYGDDKIAMQDAAEIELPYGRWFDSRSLPVRTSHAYEALEPFALSGQHADDIKRLMLPALMSERIALE